MSGRYTFGNMIRFEDETDLVGMFGLLTFISLCEESLFGTNMISGMWTILFLRKDTSFLKLTCK